MLSFLKITVIEREYKMKNNKDEKIRISIINGFLGSGKTTLLTHYISELLKMMRKLKSS